MYCIKVYLEKTFFQLSEKVWILISKITQYDFSPSPEVLLFCERDRESEDTSYSTYMLYIYVYVRKCIQTHTYVHV